MARKISDLNVQEINKVLGSVVSDPRKLSKLVAELISKAFDEGYDEAWQDCGPRG